MALLNLTLPSIGQPNSTEDVDVVNAFSAIQTVLNGNLDGTNAPALETAFSTYKTIAWGGGTVPTQGAGTTLLMSGGPGAEAAHNMTAVTAVGGAAWVFRLDPARWTANSRTTKLLLDATLSTNSVAPGVNFSIALFPVTAGGGGSGTAPAITTTGAAVTGSAAVFTTPAANSIALSASSGDFTAPAAGAFCFAVTIGGGMTAGSIVTIGVDLQMRQV